MLLDLWLEPPGEKADGIYRQWAEVLGLTMADSGQLEIRPAFCFEALADLRERCYEHGLSVNAGFTGDED